jgi:putative component of membrane protein insertase Oxa1/YidC/SpoIIIJ protein YidD
MSAYPQRLAQARNTPIWQFLIRPAVPEYCRYTPADLWPYDERAVMPLRFRRLLRVGAVHRLGAA